MYVGTIQNDSDNCFNKLNKQTNKNLLPRSCEYCPEDSVSTCNTFGIATKLEQLMEMEFSESNFVSMGISV